MERKRRLQAAYEYLRYKGKVHTQKDVASAMNATRQNVPAVLGGKDGVLTDSFIKRFNAAFDKTFNLDWLLTGDGEMLARPAHQEVVGDCNTTVQGNSNNVNCETAQFISLLKKKDEQIDRLLSIIENIHNK